MQKFILSCAFTVLLASLITVVVHGSAARSNNIPAAEGLKASPVVGMDTPLLASTPPMGWNSWDGYGTTINEDQVKANANWLAANMKPFGWNYVVVDMEWFVTNPIPEGNSKNSQYSMDSNGRYIPAPGRFPSSANGSGFKPLGDYIHSLGLKFGIHILRGIPKGAVNSNSPIANSPYKAADAADPSDLCPWNFDNFGMDASMPAAQAYYDSIAALYAGWGVDLIKVDCIASHPYKGDEIRMLSDALKKTGRPIALSLSPGPAPLEKSNEMRKYAQMWRISNDVWDLWHSDVEYPRGLGDQFENVAKWASKSEPGHWPDADMLPVGYLGPAPGWGAPRYTRLTHDEQRTLITLWCIFSSPLMLGGDLTKADEWTTSLITNREVLAVDQQSVKNHPVISTADTVVWMAESNSTDAHYVAVFNLTESSKTVHYSWKDLGLAGKQYSQRDLWTHMDAGTADGLTVAVPAHGTILYALRNVTN
jgi:alpha-galactosidase